mgnify:FL=1
MADNMNHNSVDITVEVVNRTKHLKAEEDPDYYRIAKYLNDYSALFPGEDSLSVKGRFNQEVFQRHADMLSVACIRDQLCSGLQVWQIPFKVDEFREDNDSGDSSSSEEEKPVIAIEEEDEEPKS